MKSRLVQLSALLLCVSASGAVLPLIAGKKEKLPAVDDQKRATHALNRLTFGPGPGDIQKVMAMGVDRWIDQQLHPERISDGASEARLAPLRTLRMSSKELQEDFPDQQEIRAVEQGKRPMPSDPARRAVYQVQTARLDEKVARTEAQAAAPVSSESSAPAKSPTEGASANNADSAPAADGGAKTEVELAAAAAASADNQPVAGMSSTTAAENENSPATNEMASSSEPEPNSRPSPAEQAAARQREERLYTDLKIQGLVDLPPDQRYKKVLSMTVDEQVAFADSLRAGKGQEFLEGMDPKQTTCRNVRRIRHSARLRWGPRCRAS